LIGLALLNWAVLLFIQKELQVSPLQHSLLSLVFPGTIVIKLFIAVIYN
jgi:hypothetical protein